MSQHTALDHAWRVQQDASKVGFDWPEIGGALDKVREEIEEIQDALQMNDQGLLQEELGDLLFAVVNVSRFINHHPETALTQATRKFERRFGQVKQLLDSENRVLGDCSLQELDAAWDRVKAAESDKKI